MEEYLYLFYVRSKRARACTHTGSKCNSMRPHWDVGMRQLNLSAHILKLRKRIWKFLNAIAVCIDWLRSAQVSSQCNEQCR